MKKLFLFLTISIVAGFMTACATIMRDNSQAIPIKANVEKVDIKITNKAVRLFLRGKRQPQ